MVAFVLSFLFTIALAGGILAYARRRPTGAPLSWGEAMGASALVFFVMVMAYGIVPHQWLTWADNELQWRADRTVLGPGDIIGQLPFTVTYRVLRDLVAVGIYGAMLTGQVVLWSMWQHRGRVRTKALPASAFGRPLVKST